MATNFRRRTVPKWLWRCLTAAALVLLAAAATEGLYQYTGTRRLVSVFLTAVLITAFLFGAPTAYFAAFLAIVGYNFYVAPAGAGVSWGSGDWVNLVAFGSVAMLTGNLTGRVRDQARRAEARARATAALFDATREFSGSDDEVFIKQRLAHHLGVAAKGEAAVMDAPPREPLHEEGAEPFGAEERFAPDLPPQPVASVTVRDRMMRPLYAEGVLVGVATWKATLEAGQPPDQQALLEILCEVGAAAIGRARVTAAKADMESRAKTESLRNALLSSISHDLRTPLASIVASASSLEAYGEKFDPDTRRDLAKTIQEEAERLNHFVANLLSMTKLASGVLTPRREPINVRDVVDLTVERWAGRARPRVSISGDGDPEAMADPQLVEQALGNVIENALRYSSAETSVEVSFALVDDRVTIRVIDAGPGVSSAELPMLFVKFYRTQAAEKMSGTGLGLSITKGLIEGMGGRVAAAARLAPDHGLIVSISLPAVVHD